MSGGKARIPPEGDPGEGFREMLMLVDGHSMAFRAYYALPDSLRGPDGQPVQAIYGFLGMLFRLLEDHRPRYLGVTFDEGRPFRHEIYDAYKAGREDIPDDIREQVAGLRKVLSTMAVWQVAGAPFEADDYIATLSRQARDRQLEVLVISGDRDLFQVVGPSTRVLYPIKGIKESVIYDPAQVETRFGVTPAQLTDFKALVGDPSDNIPGVKGIGEKGAAKLLQAYGDLAGIYDHLDDLPPGQRTNLETGRELADLSRQLVTLRYDAPTALDLPALELRYQREPVEQAMRELGFNSTIERLPAAYQAG